MALTVEDGTGILNADSYVALTDFRTFASNRGLTLPIADNDCEILLRKALDYIETFRDRFKGAKLFGQSYLQWPRSEVLIDNFEIGLDEIPIQLKNAQMQAAFELQSVDPMSTISEPAIRSEQVDVIKTEYAIPRDSERNPPVVMPKVDAFLAPLLKSIGIRVERM
ncbi:MAG TPA: DnaT-like ssDNA-binding protein [Candidatus Methanoperedens sp.]